MSPQDHWLLDLVTQVALGLSLVMSQVSQVSPCPPQDHWLLDLVTQVALGLSVVALVASAVTFALCRALGPLRATLHLHLSLSLLGGHLAFLLGIDRAHQPDPELGGRVLCAFWNPREGRWDTGGCRVEPPKNGGTPPGTDCACDHLTSFAVLLAFNEIQDHWLLDLVTQVALGLSVVALVASAVTFALCRALGPLRATLHLHLSLSLLGGHLAFLLGIDRAHQPVACTVTAVTLHLSYLCAFSWMALQGLHLHVLLVQVFPPAWLRRWHLLLMGYIPPVVIVAVSAAVFPGGYGTDQYCWLSLDRGFRWSFQGPVIAITVVNAIILVVTLWKLVKKFHEVNPDMGHLRRI
ncbi:hypothetical protein HGM15179_020057, partial [Zosterops borbonicus]